MSHPELGLHGAIEFGNRLLTFVLIVIAVLTFVSAALYRDPSRSARDGRRRDLFWLAGGLALGIPAQGDHRGHHRALPISTPTWSPLHLLRLDGADLAGASGWSG